MKIIKLTQGHIALIDDCDYDLVSKYRWKVKKDARRNIEDRYYAVTNCSRKNKEFTLSMHVLIMGDTISGFQVDHLNGDGRDNRRKNLRIATLSQNSQNKAKKPNCSSKYKGVRWEKNNKNFVSGIQCNGIRIHIGCFVNEIDAARAYDTKAKELFGEFARLNFP